MLIQLTSSSLSLCFNSWVSYLPGNISIYCVICCVIYCYFSSYVLILSLSQDCPSLVIQKAENRRGVVACSSSHHPWSSSWVPSLQLWLAIICKMSLSQFTTDTNQFFHPNFDYVVFWQNRKHTIKFLQLIFMIFCKKFNCLW